jgi:hypothetical protein
MGFMAEASGVALAKEVRLAGPAALLVLRDKLAIREMGI